MVSALLAIALVWAITKWIFWRISFLAILLYFAECGMDLPDAKKIQEYQTKVLQKYFTVKK